MVAAAVLLLGGGTALAGVDTVYVSNPDMDRIYAIDTDGGLAQIPAYYEEIGSNYEDLVVGPDGLFLYACDPAAGKIAAIDLATLTGTTYYTRTAGGPQNPQCGWFTHSGDLVVTDKASGDNAVWLFRAAPENFFQQCSGFTYPAPCRIEVDAGFVGAGITQAADGDLLVVDRSGEIVWSLGYELYLGAFFDGDDADPLISGAAVDDPVGVARSSRGNIYVAAAPKTLLKYDRFGGPATIPACAVGFGNKDRPYFLDFAADDTLYVATTSNNSGKVWELDVEGCDCIGGNPVPDCAAPQVLFEFKKQNGYEKSTVGIGVPFMPGSDGLGTFISGKPTSLDADPDAQVESFFDHAFEFKSEPVGCVVDITAAEATPDYLAGLAGTLGLGANAARPVFYLGENGRGILYDLVPNPDDNPGPCYAPAAELYRYAINAYAGYVPNPRLVRCVSPTSCELIALNTYFPYNGIFPEDTRVGAVKGSSTSDFSVYFMVDLDLNEDADTGDGVFCGFDSPWYEPMLTGGDFWNDADILDQVDANGVPVADGLVVISNTESFTLKFQIAEIVTDPNTGARSWDCNAGPFIEAATVLMSVAKVRDQFNVPIEPFEPKKVYSAGGSAAEDPALFNDGANPTKQYHFNAKFPAVDPITGLPLYTSGIYQIVLVPLTNNFAAEVRYFRIP
jgi:hypothetical protein